MLVGEKFFLTFETCNRWSNGAPKVRGKPMRQNNCWKNAWGYWDFLLFFFLTWVLFYFWVAVASFFETKLKIGIFKISHFAFSNSPKKVASVGKYWLVEIKWGERELQTVVLGIKNVTVFQGMHKMQKLKGFVSQCLFNKESLWVSYQSLRLSEVGPATALTDLNQGDCSSFQKSGMALWL